MEAWSLCNPYRMDYQLSHATIFSFPVDLSIIYHVPTIVNPFFSQNGYAIIVAEKAVGLIQFGG